jgi:hypothetical protein
MKGTHLPQAVILWFMFMATIFPLLSQMCSLVANKNRATCRPVSDLAIFGEDPIFPIKFTWFINV